MYGRAPSRSKTLYICSQSYDGMGFFGYPVRLGFNTEMMFDRGDYGVKSAEEVRSFFQNWLFFGLLYEVFKIALGIKVNSDHFIRTSASGKRYLTTQLLPLFTALWTFIEEMREMRETPRVRENRWLGVDSILEEAYRWIIRFGDTTARDNGSFLPQFWPLCPWLSLSIHSIWTILRYTKQHVSSGLPGTVVGPHSRMLRQEMLASGWCRSDIHLLQRKTDVLGQYYFSSYAPSHATGNVDHAECKPVKCLQDDIIEETYKPVHVQKACMCAERGPPIVLLSSIISDSRIPILRIDASKFQLTIDSIGDKTCNDNPRYVAISHVWSRGLGNPHFNTLPMCQLIRLQSAVDSMYKTEKLPQPHIIGLWIDTLCVPLKPYHLRKVAISKMNEVFRRADRVLVIDSDIEKLSVNSNWVDIFSRIAISPWQRRLWTLVEATLAQPNKLWFNCREEAISAEKVGNPSYGDPIPIPFMASMFLIQESIRTYRQIRAENLLARVSREFVHRSTGKSADEALCIGILIDLDVKFLLQEDNSEMRMTLLYQKLSKLPRWLLFVPGPRIARTGYTWAPCSFLSKSHLYALPIPPPASNQSIMEIGNSGQVRFHCNGYILWPSYLPLNRLLFFDNVRMPCILRPYDLLRDENSTPAQRQSEAGTYFLTWLSDDTPRPELCDGEPLAIITDRFMSPHSRTLMGALVALTEEAKIHEDNGLSKSDGHICDLSGTSTWPLRFTCRYLCRVAIGEGASASDLENLFMQIRATPVENVEWCIG